MAVVVAQHIGGYHTYLAASCLLVRKEQWHKK